MEYLMTYGWAILIVSTAIAALYALGLFSPSTFTHTTCVFPAGFYCLNSQMDTAGNLTINIEQDTSAPINITAIGCGSSDSIGHMISFASNQIVLQIGSNVSISGNTTESLKCWSNSTVFTSSIGSLFNGYVILNYTDTQTGFPHTVSALLSQKVT